MNGKEPQQHALIVERTLHRRSEQNTEPHRHAPGQFVLVRSGVLYGHTQDQRWLLKRNMAVWIPPDVVHWGSAFDRVELLVLYLPAEQARACGLPAVKLIDASLLIVALCERLADTRSPLTDARRTAMLDILFDEIRSVPGSTLALPLPQDARLKKIADSLVANPAQRKSLAEWGRQVGATDRTLARLLRKDTGLSFREWHNRLLLAEAWRGIASGASNEQLAAMLGFSSSDSFGHWFRRVSDQCPGQIRKRLQSGSSTRGPLPDSDSPRT
ncbi:helix-turn-helix domain-containing protein [Paraburkholderia humisilvae]|uniref:HTH-type transcriptional regulator NimR n=1 Tax=Paraburkholderia humisilvae TaxID=627669 RepID=A0A6J5CXB5_9BURK|nr:AraC family transcriptional regulator [Paraburkholderia humisilvae]CAB3746830.1 HTH-type transcriptional regulator NimR [Paraburkholderia humisilvae]